MYIELNNTDIAKIMVLINDYIGRVKRGVVEEDKDFTTYEFKKLERYLKSYIDYIEKEFEDEPF